MDNSKIIREIAQNMDCGEDSYYNPITKEIISIPGETLIADEEEFQELFRPALEKINLQKDHLIKFEVIPSSESFKIMEGFVAQLLDQVLKSDLETILGRRHPFQNFRYSIEDNDLRQEWFAFKQNALEKIVEDQLNAADPTQHN